LKVNPLANWGFSQVKQYIDVNQVPYNPLLDQGYKSVGDWHSTKAASGAVAKDVGSDADERAGRWAGRTEKTECGLHKDCACRSARRLLSTDAVAQSSKCAWPSKRSSASESKQKEMQQETRPNRPRHNVTHQLASRAPVVEAIRAWHVTVIGSNAGRRLVSWKPESANDTGH
jgi:hypothetical protein